jgi:Peptidase family M23
MKNVVLTLLFCLFAAPALALELALPVACTIGTNCWVQQFADHDAGTAATDYSCGVASYDGHDGTDIRVLNNSIKVGVVAAAAGIVKAVRDGVLDNLVKTEKDKAAIEKMECGNGVVVSHGDGWETQYCHMRKGSVSVKAGDTVVVGDRLGEIGFSGNAAFPHLHLTVRKGGKAVDPFSADMTADCKDADRSLWNSEAQKALAYKGTDVLVFQWTPHVLSANETGPLPSAPPSVNWKALVLYAQAINLFKDDVVKLMVAIPGQQPLINSVVMQRNRAVQQLHVGKKMRVNWPSGVYQGRFEILRGGVVVLVREATFTIEK